MGLMEAKLTLSNPRKPELQAVEGEALADSGAVYLVIPTHIQFQLGLDAVATKEATLADGSKKVVPYVGRGLPAPDKKRRPPPKPWFKNDIGMQDYPWVDMKSSLRWRAFRSVVQTLERRNNRVFVLVGPFNEHLLKPASLQQYQQVAATIEAWLQAEAIPYFIAPLLDSDQYGDASHPLADGYQVMARQLIAAPSFKSAFRPR